MTNLQTVVHRTAVRYVLFNLNSERRFFHGNERKGKDYHFLRGAIQAVRDTLADLESQDLADRSYKAARVKLEKGFSFEQVTQYVGEIVRAEASEKGE